MINKKKPPEKNTIKTHNRNDALKAAYDHCLKLAQSHYENFPVASFLVPRNIRQAIAAIYAFARTADDFADEGDSSPSQRLKSLQSYRDQLQDIDNNQDSNNPIFIALSDSIKKFNLPLLLFNDLLTAFMQDVTTTRYASEIEVLNYCQLSANPIGRLLLHLNNSANNENLKDSDAICTSLQLINFLQDLAQDYSENDRIYISKAAMIKHGIDEQWFADLRSDAAMGTLIKEQIDSTRAMMLQGAPLAWRLKGRFGFELRLIVCAGLRVLDLLETNKNDVFSRPRLSLPDKVWILLRASIGGKLK